MRKMFSNDLSELIDPQTFNFTSLLRTETLPYKRNFLSTGMITEDQWIDAVALIFQLKEYFGLLSSTTELAMIYLNGVLEKNAIIFPLLEHAVVTCLFIASKVEGDHVALIRDYRNEYWLNTGKNSNKRIKDLDLNLLEQYYCDLLDWKLHYVTPSLALETLIQSGTLTTKSMDMVILKEKANELVKLCFLDYALAGYSATQIACGALNMAEKNTGVNVCDSNFTQTCYAGSEFQCSCIEEIEIKLLEIGVEEMYVEEKVDCLRPPRPILEPISPSISVSSTSTVCSPTFKDLVCEETKFVYDNFANLKVSEFTISPPPIISKRKRTFSEMFEESQEEMVPSRKSSKRFCLYKDREELKSEEEEDEEDEDENSMKLLFI